MKRKIDELEHQDSTKKKVTQNIDINSIAKLTNNIKGTILLFISN